MNVLVGNVPTGCFTAGFYNAVVLPAVGYVSRRCVSCVVLLAVAAFPAGVGGHRPGGKELIQSHRIRLDRVAAPRPSSRGQATDTSVLGVVAGVADGESIAGVKDFRSTRGVTKTSANASNVTAARAPASGIQTAGDTMASSGGLDSHQDRRATRRSSLMAVVAVGRGGALLHRGGRHRGRRGRVDGAGSGKGGGDGGGGGGGVGGNEASSDGFLHGDPSSHGVAIVGSISATSVQNSVQRTQEEAQLRDVNKPVGLFSDVPEDSADPDWTIEVTNHENHVPSPFGRTCAPWAPLAIKPFAKRLCVFYGAIYFAFALGYFFVFNVASSFIWLWTPISQASKYVSRSYDVYPRLLPALYTFLLFGAADVLGQTTRAYWHDEDRSWDWRFTVAIAFMSSLFYGGLLTFFYRWIDDFVDSWLGDRDQEWTDLVKRTVVTRVLFLLVYLPVVAFLFEGAACFLSRSIIDATTNCVASSLVAVPSRVLSTGSYGLNNAHDKVIACAMFWPPIQVINHFWVRRWSPEFRTTLDAATVLLWDAFVVLRRLDACAAPLAIGPTLAGHGPGVDEEDPPEAVLCSRWTFLAMAKRFAAEVKLIAHMLWNATVYVTETVIEYTHKFLNACLANTEHLCYMIRWYTYTGFWFFIFVTRVTLYLSVGAAWLCVGAPFFLFDQIKGAMFLSFIPQLFPYGMQPYNILWPYYETDRWVTPWTIDQSYDRMWPKWYE
eukprot:TRINITY_DN10594_c0_g2_i2.p1 TRINITY_DN10594_c0_g2~~TRINITY_DN10594_c0_g2_i2.p1  ORF type:complete len:721 (+),score=112.66 TRINITY_DN10594_c0_g2_i2:148-2310(+)